MTLPEKVLLLLLWWVGQDTVWIEFTLYHSMQVSDNMNVKSITFSWRRDQPWINRKVRCVHVRHYWAVLGCGKTQISCL